MSLLKNAALKNNLKLKLSRGNYIIDKVTGPTPWVSQLVIGPKSNGKLRVCVDMRPANGEKAFHQIELEKGSRHLTTFPKTIPLQKSKFRLRDFPEFNQRTPKWSWRIFLYCHDEILVHGKTMEEHNTRLSKVRKRLQEWWCTYAGLYVNLLSTKCAWKIPN